MKLIYFFTSLKLKSINNEKTILRILTYLRGDNTKVPNYLSSTQFNFQILLYDIRSAEPYVCKSHNFSLPITQIDFVRDQELVVSRAVSYTVFGKKKRTNPSDEHGWSSIEIMG